MKVTIDRGSRKVTSWEICFTCAISQSAKVLSAKECLKEQKKKTPNNTKQKQSKARKASENWAKVINKPISEGETQMAKKNTENCSISISHQRKAN